MKTIDKILILSMSLLGATIIVIGMYFVQKNNQEKDRQTAVVQVNLDKERASKTSCIYLKDSLIRINAMLSTYKTLTASMIYRDEVLGELKHKVGDMVYLKNDSSKVVVEDVIIGGSNHSYYVKYKVILKNGSEKEIMPELIY